jgi:histone-lysine N-methyltransferase SETMAR
MKPAIESNAVDHCRKGLQMLHDNAPPHTVESISHLNCEMLKHPPCSPDLAPSDCQVFGPLKEALRGRRSSSDQDVKQAVHA